MKLKPLIWVLVIAISGIWTTAALAETPIFEEPMAGSIYPPKVAYGVKGSIAVAGTVIKESGEKDWSVSLYKRDSTGEYSLFWRKSYDGGHDDTVSAVAITPKGEVVVVGTTNNGKDDDCLVIMFSEEGEVKWQRGYPGPHGDKGLAVAVWVNPEGEERIAVGGITNNGSDDDLLVLLYNGQGGMVWSNPLIYNDEGDDSLVALKFDHNGNLLVLGNSGSEEDKHWVLLSYQSQGERSWVKKEYGDGTAEATDLALDNKGRTLVCGTTNGGEGNDWIFVQYSSSGGVFWRGYYRGDHEDRALSATDIPGVGWAIGGTSYVSEKLGKEGLLLAVDKEGKELWRKWLSEENDQSITQVKGDLSTHIVAIGISNNGKDDDWWIGRFSSLGEKVWEYTYDGGTEDTDPQLSLAPDGGIALVGRTGEDWKLMAFGQQYGTETLGQKILFVSPKEKTNVSTEEYLGIGQIANGGDSVEFSVAFPVFLDNSTYLPLQVAAYAGIVVPSVGILFFDQEFTLTTQDEPVLKDLSYPVEGTLLPSIRVRNDEGELTIPEGEYLFFIAALYGEDAENFKSFNWETQKYFIEYTAINLR